MKLFILQAYLLTDDDRKFLEAIADDPRLMPTIPSMGLEVAVARYEVRKAGQLVAYIEKDTP